MRQSSTETSTIRSSLSTTRVHEDKYLIDLWMSKIDSTRSKCSLESIQASEPPWQTFKSCATSDSSSDDVLVGFLFWNHYLHQGGMCMWTRSVEDLKVFWKQLKMSTNDAIRYKNADTPTENLKLSAKTVGENLQINLFDASSFLFWHHLILRL